MSRSLRILTGLVGVLALVTACTANRSGSIAGDPTVGSTPAPPPPPVQGSPYVIVNPGSSSASARPAAPSATPAASPTAKASSAPASAVPASPAASGGGVVPAPTRT